MGEPDRLSVPGDIWHAVCGGNSRISPDKSREGQAILGNRLVIGFGLTPHWIAPWRINSGGLQTPHGLLAIAIGLFVIGVFLHFTTGKQEPSALTPQQGHYITTGMGVRSRNLNCSGALLT